MRFWYYWGHATEGERCLSALLALSAEAGARTTCSRSLKAARAALMAAGFIAGFQRHTGESRAFAEEALALWRELGDGRGIAFSLWELGQSARLDGEFARAGAYTQESLEESRRLGSRPLMSAALRELGGLAHRSRNYDRGARKLYEEAWPSGRAGRPAAGRPGAPPSRPAGPRSRRPASGQLAVGLGGAPPQDIAALKVDSTLSYRDRPGPVAYTLHFNEAKQPFGTRELRQAISFAIDRAAISHAVFFDTALPQDVIFNSTIWTYDRTTTPSGTWPRLKPYCPGGPVERLRLIAPYPQ